MFTLISLICGVLYSLLHDSPFRPFIEKLQGFNAISNLFGNINWFIPFDICEKITLAWVGAVFIFYNVDKVKGFLNNIINKFTGN